MRSVCTGANGSIARRVDGEAAVLDDADAGDADERLGDHALGRRAPRQRRDRRDVVLREGEAGGLPRRAVGQAADAGGRARTQRRQARERRGRAAATSSPVEAADHRAGRRRSRGPV